MVGWMDRLKSEWIGRCRLPILVVPLVKTKTISYISVTHKLSDLELAIIAHCKQRAVKVAIVYYTSTVCQALYMLFHPHNSLYYYFSSLFKERN